jgi:hypothetical protein
LTVLQSLELSCLGIARGSVGRSNMMLAAATCALLVLAALQLAVIECALMTSKIPVQLSLKRINGFRNATEPKAEARSKPAFFANVLGLQPESPANLDINLWRALRDCGMFVNLTATTFIAEDGGVRIGIEGYEIPTMKFSPEVTVAASLERPEVSGGVSKSHILQNHRSLGLIQFPRFRIATDCTALHDLASYSLALHRNFEWPFASLCIALHRFASLCIALHRFSLLRIDLHRLASLCKALLCIALHCFASHCIALIYI